jgi:hypothetical protein
LHGFCEKFDLVAGFVPVDMKTGANTSDAVCLKDYGGCVVVLYKSIGTAGDDPTITILQGTDVAFGTSKALTFTTIYTKQGLDLAAVTQWTKTTQTAASTYTDATSAELSAIWAIEFNAEDLDVSGGYDCIRASVADIGANVQLGCTMYIMTKPRYPQATLPTSITD